MPIGHDCKVTTVAAVVTGTSTITGTALDMAGFEGALFICRLGTPATNNSLHLTQCDTVAGSYAAILGTSVGSHASDTPLIIDIYRPKEQFIKYVVTRGTTSTIDIVAIVQYGAGNRPTTQPSGTQIEHFYDTAEGAA